VSVATAPSLAELLGPQDEALVLYDAALVARRPRRRWWRPAPGARLRVRSSGGGLRALPLERYLGMPGPAEESVLMRARGPVLDVGCGPARLTVALARRGVPALGVDIAPAAVALARRRGAAVLQRSVFAELPGAGRWASTLLLDGNLGIGGDPVRLVSRIRRLLRPGGELLVELDPPGTPSGPELLRLERDAAASAWFPWARVGADQIGVLAARCELVVGECWSVDGRWFARLRA